MGLAWVDDGPADEGEPDLRFGGRPLLLEAMEWPCCPLTGAPMLFRGQVPLALTALASFDDDRLISMFECQGERSAGGCAQGCGVALVLDGSAAVLRDPPASAGFDVLLTHLGEQPEQLRHTLDALELTLPRRTPSVLLENVPPSIAHATAAALGAVGAVAKALSSPPTVMSHFAAGKVVPFEDGFPGARKTTLPPLDYIIQQQDVSPMRGVFGGTHPGYRDHAYRCDCGRVTRTAVQLLSNHSQDPRVQLDGAHVQYCTACGQVSMHRNPRGTGSRSAESVASQ